MKYKVLVGYSGVVSAPLDSIVEYTDEVIINDLLQAGYIEPVKQAKTNRGVNMKVSELNIDIISNYIRVDVTADTKPILDMVLSAAISYCMTYMGIADKTTLDDYEDMPIAVLSLCGEFYDNRTFTAVENAVVNPTAQAILDKYSMNLL